MTSNIPLSIEQAKRQTDLAKTMQKYSDMIDQEIERIIRKSLEPSYNAVTASNIKIEREKLPMVTNHMYNAYEKYAKVNYGRPFNSLEAAVYVSGYLPEKTENVIQPTKLVFNNPHTIATWSDGSVTRCEAKGDEFNEYTGYLLCLAKYLGIKFTMIDNILNADNVIRVKK